MSWSLIVLAHQGCGPQIRFKTPRLGLPPELGTVRELISRKLGGPQAEGYLDVDGRNIIVKGLTGLKREQESPEYSNSR